MCSLITWLPSYLEAHSNPHKTRLHLTSLAVHDSLPDTVIARHMTFTNNACPAPSSRDTYVGNSAEQHLASSYVYCYS